MKNDLLKTNRLVLEKLNRNHSESLFKVLKDSAVYSYIPQNAPLSIAELRKCYTKLENNLLAPDGEIWINYAVRIFSSDEYIGRIEATVSERKAEIAYLFGSRYWGFGYASESIRKLIAFLKQEYGVFTVKASTDTRNTNSIALLERLEFKFIRRVDEADYFKGETSNEYVYELQFTNGAVHPIKKHKLDLNNRESDRS